MKIAVLGGDGYCGWATALYLSQRGHSVAIVDNFLRRLWDHELGAPTLTPIRPLTDRVRVWQNLTGKTIEHIPILRTGSGGPFRGTALCSLFDDRPKARRLHPGQ